ncbi:hypothetical protein [Lignipirellula cremea]|uniref:Uncharacterized protein n=1 Tax=Lignipirellula cremea TaxID=2528010 RepID=A0A518DWA1_9BACT|nr:hypothetical protein [Lignipirellula cremea]QDU96116.1 hypothetical protein Pla8534_39350 [Lignipirellula cremea]
MRRFFPAVLVALAITSGLRLLQAEQPFAPDNRPTNAALVYWTAFAMLPELSDEESDLLPNWGTGEMRLKELASLRSQSRTSLQLAGHAEPTMDCQWQLIDSGPATLLPHISKARLLGMLFLLQAEADVAAGKNKAAIEHLASAWLLARNIDEGALIQLLVGHALEAQVLNIAEPLLPTLNAQERAQFKAAFEALPAPVEYATAIGYEQRMFGEWLRPLLTGEPQEAVARFKEISGQVDPLMLLGIFAGSKEVRLQRFNDFIGEYDKVAKASQLPPEEAKAEMKRLEEALPKSKNALARVMMPAFARSFTNHLELQARIARFKKALQDAPAGK